MTRQKTYNMAKIHTLKISNYKGIKKFEQVFGMTDFVCLIGRGDSGKTTILEAINAVLSASWNLTFYDTDFYNSDINNSIEIEVSLYDLPNKILQESKFGLHKRFLTKEGVITDNVFDEELDERVNMLTIKLTVEKDLEPKWLVTNNRAGQESVEIRANDRASLNVFLVSDYIDRHFSWSKGNPLYSLLKEEDTTTGKTNVIIDAFRDVKDKIDPTSFNYLEGVVKKIKAASSTLGVDIANTNTTIDFKDISIKDGRICLHENKVPFRLKGKGSKRLISIAIQTELANSGGILLIDEIEQGLESDRAQHLVRTLKNQKKGQVFITTHSRDIIVEIQSENIYRIKRGGESLFSFDSSLQSCLRNNPEAFFAKRVLVCEGATEVGICRAINENRVSNGKSSFSILGIGIVDGSGSSFVKYCEDFKAVDIDTCAFCDSDDQPINSKKSVLKEKGIFIIDCDNGNAIEEQIFKELHWEGIVKLIDYAIEEKGEVSITELTKTQFGKDLPIDWKIKEADGIRVALGKASTLKSWFKRIDHGIFLGETLCAYLADIKETKLGKQIYELNSNRNQ